MDSKLKQDWVAALETKKIGEREITQHRGGWGGYGETDVNELCCLNVLHVVATGRNAIVSRHYTDGDGFDRVSTLVGISVATQLSDMNDRQGKSFTQIAQWVKENL